MRSLLIALLYLCTISLQAMDGNPKSISSEGTSSETSDHESEPYSIDSEWNLPYEMVDSQEQRDNDLWVTNVFDDKYCEQPLPKLVKKKPVKKKRAGSAPKQTDMAKQKKGIYTLKWYYRQALKKLDAAKKPNTAPQKQIQNVNLSITKLRSAMDLLAKTPTMQDQRLHECLYCPKDYEYCDTFMDSKAFGQHLIQIHSWNRHKVTEFNAPWNDEYTSACAAINYCIECHDTEYKALASSTTTALWILHDALGRPPEREQIKVPTNPKFRQKKQSGVRTTKKASLFQVHYCALKKQLELAKNLQKKLQDTDPEKKNLIDILNTLNNQLVRVNSEDIKALTEIEFSISELDEVFEEIKNI